MKKKILSLMVSTGPYQAFVKSIYNLASHNQSSYICVANVHMLIEAHQSPSFAQCVNNADIVTPDGMPLVKSMKWLHGIRQSRVAGMDLLPDLLLLAEKKEIPVYFYGSTDEVLEKTTVYLEKNYPRLNLAGTYSPPFRNLSDDEQEIVINKINESGAKIIFVALGCPKQESWMASMKGRIHGCMIGIGGALPVLVGMQKRAPLWMQKACLEWVYRLAQEPGRLFKRYAVTNSLFVYLLFKSWLKERKAPATPTPPKGFFGDVYNNKPPEYHHS